MTIVAINATVSFLNCYRNIISDAQMASIGLAPLKAAKCEANLYQLRIWPTVKRKKRDRLPIWQGTY